MSLILLLACAASEPDAALYAQALDASLSDTSAVERCRQVASPEVRSECLATVVRDRPGLPDQLCDEVEDPRWAGECWFTVGERRGAAGERWPALEACGRSGPYYDECLYHLWTAELSQAAEAAPDAVSALPGARESISFWSGLQTLEGSAEDQLWGDFWFFAHNAHRPADLGDCQRLDPAGPEAAALGSQEGEVGRCEEGTRTFVLRALMGELLAPGRPPDLLDRVCRSAQVPPLYLDGLYLPHPELDAAQGEVVDLACVAATGKPVRRWNPVFTAVRGGSAPKLPGQPQ